METGAREAVETTTEKDQSLVLTSAGQAAVSVR